MAGAKRRKVGAAGAAVAAVPAASEAARDKAQDVRREASALEAERKELASVQRSARRAADVALRARRCAGVAQRALAKARAHLQQLRSAGAATLRAAAEVAARSAQSKAAARGQSQAGREAASLRNRRRQQEQRVKRAVARRQRAEKALRAAVFEDRQKRAMGALLDREHHRRYQLECRQAGQLNAMRLAHAAAQQALHNRQRQDLTTLAQESKERARQLWQQQQEGAKAYREWLASDEVRHADQFRRCEGGSLGSSLCILRPRTGRHQYTLVYLHQFNCEGFGYAYFKPHYFYSATKFRFNGLKIVLPTAPSIPITAHEGEEKHAWFDYLTDSDGVREDKVNMRSLRETRSRIFLLLEREIKLLDGDASRVFLGGASQGCCTALHCALQFPRMLGGVVGIVGHLLSCTSTPASKRRMPISLYNGLDDRMMRWTWVRGTFKRLKDAGYQNVRIHCEQGVGHDTGPKEREWLMDFLSRSVRES